MSGQRQPSHQLLSPATRNGLWTILPEDVEWLFLTSQEIYLCCGRGRPLEFHGGNVSPRVALMSSSSPTVILNQTENVLEGQGLQLFQRVPVEDLNPPVRGLTQAPPRVPPGYIRGKLRLGKPMGQSRKWLVPAKSAS